jgi:hypothetical protein
MTLWSDIKTTRTYYWIIYIQQQQQKHENLMYLMTE